MPSEAISDIVEMMQGLPETLQREIVRHLRDYLEDIRDEQLWDEKFRMSKDRLSALGRRASEQIESGMATRLDHDLL